MKAGFLKRFLFGLNILIVFISFMDAAVYLSMRSIWFFIDKTLSGLSGAGLPWAVMFFILFIASFIYLLTLFKRFDVKKTVLALILIFIFSAIDIYLYIQLQSSRDIVLTNLIAALPGFLAVLAVIFLIVFYPGLKISHNKAFKYIVAAVFIIAALLYLTNSGGVRITSGPVIQLADSSNLSIVWTTNKNSTAFVEYGPDEKSLKRQVAEHNGVIDANTTVHKVNIPIDSQSSLVYRVGSTKINNYYQNSVEYGNTVVSSFKKYSDYRLKDKITFYVLNDIHDNNDIYKKFLSKDDYDFVVLNGDMVNSVDSRKVIENRILKPVSIFTDGSKPFYFVRGNHETRGAALRDLPYFISTPQDKYYYTFGASSLYAVVLDSGEDKPDSDEEYSGLADFEDYLGNETAWLQELSQSDEYKAAKYKIAFSHIPLNSFDELDKTSYLRVCQQKWSQLLKSMKIEAVFSGHTHVPQAIEPDKAGLDFETFIGGGDPVDEKPYIAVKVEVTKECMNIYYINTAGAVVNRYVVKSGGAY